MYSAVEYPSWKVDQMFNRYGISVLVCHKWPRIWSVYRNYNPVLSSFVTYNRFTNDNKPKGATNGDGMPYPSGLPAFIPVFQWVSAF